MAYNTTCKCGRAIRNDGTGFVHITENVGSGPDEPWFRVIEVNDCKEPGR